MKTRRAAHGPPSTLAQIGYLARRMPGLLAVLTLASVVAGLVESGILAVLAESALLLADGRRSLSVHAGPLHLDASIGLLVLIGVGLACLRLALGALLSFVPARITANTQAELRTRLFRSFAGASWSVQSRDREGLFQELITNHVGQAVGVFMSSAQLITAVVTFLALVASAVALSPLAALGIIVVVAAVSAALRPLSNLGQRRSRVLSGGWLDFANGVTEAVRLAEEAHTFGVEDQQTQRLDRLVAAVRKPILHTMWLAGLIPNIYQGMVYLLLVLALAALSSLGSGRMASLSVVILVLIRAGAYGQQVQSALQAVRQAQPYLERVTEAERLYRDSTPLPGTHRMPTVDQIRFESVSFGYGGARPSVLEAIDFTVERGEAVGIIGPTGAGKSTLVQIILRLRQPTSGRYLVNGLSADEIMEKDWRRAFAYLGQEPRLLHASVADNIRFFRDISDRDVERAARDAGLHDEVASWASGYDTIVGPRSDAVSGGQQQRICMARALAANPQVLVLDEPTSALDPLTEQVIQESLERLRSRLTLFIVAHRMSTLDICERVMVVIDGRMQAFDGVDALAHHNDYYRAATAASTVTAGRPL